MFRFRPIHVRPAHVRELEVIYAEIVLVWQQGIASIIAGYEQEQRKDIVHDSADDVKRLIELVALETNRAMVRISGRLRDWARGVEKFHRETWADGVLSATGVRLDTILNEHDVTETVEAVIARNVELIRDIDTQARGRIADIVFRGLTARLSAREVGNEIEEAVDMSRKRARNIARDQAVKIASALDQARQEEAGLQHFIWRHSGKLHFRPEHKARNGILYKWRKSAPDPGRDPPEGDMPGYRPYCGCIAQGVLVIDGEAL